MDASTQGQYGEYAGQERERSQGRQITQTRVGNLRWGIALLLGVGILINYFNRVNISVATAPMIADFHLSRQEFGIVLSAFA